MTKNYKLGYIALSTVTILIFLFDNCVFIASTHIGQISGGLLGSIHELVYSSTTAILIFIFIPSIVSIIVSAIVFKIYRKALTKTTTNIVALGFLPYLLFTLLRFGNAGMIAIAVGIIKVIYSIIVIIFMLKSIKKIVE